MNAQWHVSGVDQKGSYAGLYLSSPDLRNTREAKRRARETAKKRWKRKGLNVRVVSVMCVG